MGHLKKYGYKLPWIFSSLNFREVDVLKAKIVVLTFFLGLLGVILLQNTAPVETKILFMSFTLPRAALLFLVAFVGFLCGVVLTLVVRKKSGVPSESKGAIESHSGSD